MTRWVLPPLIPGNWIELRAEEEREFAYVYATSWAASQQGIERDFTPIATRARKLACYRDTLLVEVQARISETGETGIMAMLYAPDRLVILDGQSMVLHELAEQMDMLDLRTEEAVREYAMLFCGAIQADEGRFEIIVDEAQLRSPEGKKPSDAASLMIGNGIALTQMPGQWLAKAVMRYGPGLFEVELQIDIASGYVEMSDDSPIDGNGGFTPDRRHRQFRVEDREPEE